MMYSVVSAVPAPASSSGLSPQGRAFLISWLVGARPQPRRARAPSAENKNRCCFQPLHDRYSRYAALLAKSMLHGWPGDLTMPISLNFEDGSCFHANPIKSYGVRCYHAYMTREHCHGSRARLTVTGRYTTVTSVTRPLHPLHPSCTRSVGILGLGPLRFLFFVFPSRPLPLTPPGRPLTVRSKTLGPGACRLSRRATVTSVTPPRV